jgi:hypothetical protein
MRLYTLLISLRKHISADFSNYIEERYPKMY